MDTARCVLCRIVAGELRVDRIVETGQAIGVLNEAEALARGHCVFFPKRHAPSLHEVYKKNTLAGQTVFHAHLHLPRSGARTGA